MSFGHAQAGCSGGVWVVAVLKWVNSAAFRALAVKSGSNGRRLMCFCSKVIQTGAVWSAGGQKSLKQAAFGPLQAKSMANGSRLARWSAKVGQNGAV